MADDEIVVEIEKDGAVEAGKETPAADPVADLKAQLEDIQTREASERAGREAAERREATERQARLASEREVETSRTEITETRLGTVESGLAEAQTTAESAKSAYAAAMEVGDWKKAADEQQKLSRAEARIVRLEEAKADLEVAKAAPREETRRDSPREQQRTEAPADPIEAFISGPVDAHGNRRAPEAQRWLRDHKDYVSDPRKLKKLGAADMDAQAEGIEINSAAYFAHVEKFLGLSKTNGAGNGSQTPKRAISAPVAPVNASAGPGNGGGDVVKLSAGEARAATDGTLVWNYDDPSGQKKFKKGDAIGVQEMARRKLSLSKDGRYDPMNFVQQ